MKAYIITEREMDGLRDALQLAFLRHCEHNGIKPNLSGPEAHSYSLWSAFNFAYCRWRDAMGDPHPRNLSIENMQSVRPGGFDRAMAVLRKAKLSTEAFDAAFEALRAGFSADADDGPKQAGGGKS